MRRTVHGLGLAVLSSAFGWGCALTPPPVRPSAPPLNFYQRAAQDDRTSVKPDPFAPSDSPPRYRLGSILFRRFRPAEPALPPIKDSKEKESLARFFPSLYGSGQGDPTRLAKARRPEGGEPSLMERNLLSGRLIERTKTDLRDNVEPPLLPVGLRVEAFPKSPSPSLPPTEAVARRDEPKPEADPEPRERLVSNESVVPDLTPTLTPSPKKPDPIDALDLDLKPAASPPAEPSVDPESRPTSATVEPPVAPVVAPVVDAKPPGRAPESSLPRTSPDDDPVLAGRPRMPRVETVRLPPAEFPSTYHGESLKSVLRQSTEPSAAPEGASAQPRRSILRRIFSPKAAPASPSPEKATADDQVRPSSGMAEPMASGDAKPRDVPKWWKPVNRVASQGLDKPSER